jgi:transposase InsO family protein
LLERYFFWRHDQFSRLVSYPIPADVVEKRLEIVKLYRQGWSETTVAKLLKVTRKTVQKWVRRSRQTPTAELDRADWLFDLSHAPLKPRRKVYFSAIHALLQLQKKYPGACWFRLQGYLSRDFSIDLGQTTIKKITKLNRRLHLVPPKPLKLTVEKEEREAPPASRHPFEYAFIDIRYLDAKPEGVQLYSCLLLEGFSRTILAGSLTRRQDLGVVLRLYYLALLRWGCWNTIVSDHGSQFTSAAFRQTNRRLGITHHLYDKGRPWQEPDRKSVRHSGAIGRIRLVTLRQRRARRRYSPRPDPRSQSVAALRASGAQRSKTRAARSACPTTRTND